MFTGIVEARGRVAAIVRGAKFTRIRIVTDMPLSDLKEGDSVSVSGACLTATTVDPALGEFAADVSPETLRVTTLGTLRPGDAVNLEQALRLDGLLGGHLVLGHVDCVGSVVDKRQTGEGYIMGFLGDSGRYLIEKGSVAVDGVSLTVNEVEGNRFSVAIIPHTAALTGLTEKKVNDKVNLEFDIIGKYVEKFVSSQGRPQGNVNEDLLREHGFI